MGILTDTMKSILPLLPRMRNKGKLTYPIPFPYLSCLLDDNDLHKVFFLSLP